MHVKKNTKKCRVDFFYACVVLEEVSVGGYSNSSSSGRLEVVVFVCVVILVVVL